MNAVAGDVTPQDIGRAIRSDYQHPYLYFTEADKPSILERIENDPYCHDIMQQLLAEANRYMYTPVDHTPPPKERLARWVAELPNYNYIQNYAGAAFTLAFVYQMTGDEKYAQKAFEFADTLCDLPTWMHGAADLFDIMYDRVVVWGANDDQVVFHFGQTGDHTVFRLAAVYDWLYPALTKRQRDRIRGALLEKALLRVRGNYEYHWWTTAYRCNWCAVLNSSLGVASIALFKEDPQLADVIAESYNRTGKTLDQIRGGGWQEGISYLDYTIGSSLMFADALKRFTDAKYNLYEHPGFHDAVKTFVYGQIPPDKSLHFGDSGGDKIGSYYLYNSLMLETGDRQAAWLRKHLAKDRPSSVYDLIRPQSTIEPALPESPSIHFDAVDWVIMRSDFSDPKKVVVAAKSGYNDDPHHGHLDVGHFSLYWRGQEFISDQGSAGYDEAYFDNERWDYPLASSIGHNVIFVNGEKQIPCKLKDEPWNLTIHGEVLEFRPGNERDYVLMDPSNAYPKKELKGWRRHITLEKPVITVVLDEVTCVKGAEIEARFHGASRRGSSGSENIIVTRDKKDVYVLLNGEKGAMALIPVVEGDFTIRPGKHAILLAKENASLYWIPYFGIVKKAQQERTLLGTIILPVDNEYEAKKIAESVRRAEDSSGNLTISFIKAGKTYKYLYKKNSDGLVLK